MTAASIDTTQLDELFATLRAQLVSGKMTLDQLTWYSNLTAEERAALMEDEDEEDHEEELDETSTEILRLLPCSPLTLAATDGTQTIPNAKDVFTGWIDGDFVNYGANEAGGPTQETQVSVYEMVDNARFQEMFGSLSQETDRLCMTHHQIIEFVQTHRQHLRTEGYATFFLFKSKGKFFVANVHVVGGHLWVNVRQFGNDRVWYAEDRHRVVVPQLEAV